MKKFLIASMLTASVGLGTVYAQNTSFSDVPADSYAADAVSQLVELGIVNGFPDGTFKGNDPFNRYQAALVISRLMDVLDKNAAAASALSQEDLDSMRNAMSTLSQKIDVANGQVGALSDRVTALENAGPSADLAALADRVSALESSSSPEGQSFTDLETRVTTLEQSFATQQEVKDLRNQLKNLQSKLGVSAPTSAAPQAAPSAEAAESTSQSATQSVKNAAATVTEPEVTLEPGKVAAPKVAAERGKFYIGAGAAYEINAVDNLRFLPRAHMGVDHLVGNFGLRVAADVGRQSSIEKPTVAASGDLIYSVGKGNVSGYLGVGGGFQFDDLIAEVDAYQGPFVGGLLGVEFGQGPITFFIEGGADYYLADGGITTPGYGTQIYPTAAVGINLRP